MNLQLVIDTREKNSQQIISFFEQNKQKGFEIIVAVLDVGDFLFRYANKDQPNNFVDLVTIEKKTISDLLSSMLDGRYAEQKTRLKALAISNPQLHVCYLIEGLFSIKKTDRYFTEIDRKKVEGAYLGLMIRDKIPVINTKDFADTMNMLLKTVKLISEYPKCFDNYLPTTNIPTKNVATTGTINGSNTDDNNNSHITQCNEDEVSMEQNGYLIPVKIKKSENRDARWCYLAQLQQIQGVSEQVALRISEDYPNLQSLLQAYTNPKCQNKAQLLAELDLPDRKLTKTGKTRTLGPKLSETIWISLGSP
jgi:ERCC4-type nuclease